jgi:hypothetical protein
MFQFCYPTADFAPLPNAAKTRVAHGLDVQSGHQAEGAENAFPVSDSVYYPLSRGWTGPL